MTISVRSDLNFQSYSTNERKNLALGLFTLALSIANSPNAQAALINGVTATTDMTPFDTSSGVIDNIVNGSGLSSLSLTATHINAQNPTVTGWASTSGVTTGNFTFNLNGVYDVAGFSVWNWNNNNTFGVNGVNILTSTNGIDFTPVAGAPTQFAQGSRFVTTPQSPERFSFAPVNASFVRFNVLSNQGAGIALAEVQFDSASATDPATSVPEPVTIFGTLMGLGSSAALKRRLKGVKSKSV